MQNVTLGGGFKRDQSRRGLAERTIKERDKILKAFETWAGPLTVATREQVNEWLDSRSLGPRSRSSYLSALHAFFEWCVSEGHRVDDPTLGIRRPRLPRLIPRPLNENDLRRAIKGAPPRMKAWLALAAYEGFRCKEIASLRREDIQEDRTPPVIRVDQGKGGHSAILPLNPFTLASLRSYGLPRRGFVFLNRDGRPYQPRTISLYGNSYLRDLGINGTMHQARHWYGTAVWALTKDMRVTQELLRHTDPSTTAGYAAYDQALAAQAIAAIHLS